MAFGVVTFDQLNQLVGMKRSEAFIDYFAPMKISEERKSKRIRLAEHLYEEFLYMMSYMFYAYPHIDANMAYELRDRYIQQLEILGLASMAAVDQANKFAFDVVDATMRHSDDPYFYSADRARLCAEDQSNNIYDMSDFADAAQMGYTHKTWETVGDNRVRDTHEEIAGVTLPLEEPFVLAGGLMQHPHDDSLGVDDSELCGCRCSLSFSYGEE